MLVNQSVSPSVRQSRPLHHAFLHSNSFSISLVLIIRVTDRETLWTRAEEEKILAETKSQSHPEAGSHEILEMFNRGCVTDNLTLLKDFLFFLSISNMSYRPKCDTWWQDISRNAIQEILVFYDNAVGSMSFSLCYTSEGKRYSKYFHEVFVNLNKYFQDQQLLLYVSFKSVFSTGLTIEFLGSCASHPINGLEQSLANKSRFYLTQLRAKSALQKVTKFAMQCSSGWFALNLFYPLLSRSCRFGDVNDVLDVNMLVQLYRNLNLNPDNPAHQNQKQRLGLVSKYPLHKVFVDRRDLQWLHFLTFYVFQYFDGRFPNDRPTIRNREVQTYSP